MKSSVIIFGLFVSASWLGGCSALAQKGTEGSADATIAEIDAIGKLSFDSEREAGYKQIAERDGLSREAQIHLVEAVLGKLSFDGAKEELLLTLIANPSFSSAAEREILNSVDRLAFESSKKRILKAISDRKK